MIYELPSSAKLSVNVPEFNGWLMYDVLYFAWSCFPHSLLLLCAGSVHHTQYGQFCIWVSILSPIFLVVYCWKRLCLLVGKKVVSCLWFSVHSKMIFIQSSSQLLVWVNNFLSLVFQILGLLENVALVPEVGVGVSLDLFHAPKRKVSPL